MSITLDTIKAARAWQRDHDEKPDVLLVSETRLRAIAAEAIRPGSKAMPLLTPEQIDQCVRDVRTGEDYCRIAGYDLGIDDTLSDDDVQPTMHPRSIYTGVPGGRIVGPEREALLLQATLDDPRVQIAFDTTLDVDAGAQLIPAEIMLTSAGVDHPVLVLPAAVRPQWEANPGPLLTEYTGPLPTAGNAGTSRRFGLVKPKPRT
jgi:hypothetical protein